MISSLSRASRALSFAPTYRCDGDLESLEQGLGAAVVAVLSEALSNVVKHASATGVDVRLEVQAATVSLTVADNGCGMLSDPARGNGLTNMDRRAKRYGGTFTSRPNTPHGTIVQWLVPAATTADYIHDTQDHFRSSQTG